MAYDHPLATRKSVTMSDLLTYPRLTFSYNYDMPIDFAEGIGKSFLGKSSRVIEVNDRYAITSFLHTTDAVLIGSGLLVESISDPRVISKPIENPGETMTLGWLRHKNIPLKNESRHFLKAFTKAVTNSQKYTSAIWENEQAPLSRANV